MMHPSIIERIDILHELKHSTVEGEEYPQFNYANYAYTLLQHIFIYISHLLLLIATVLLLS